MSFGTTLSFSTYLSGVRERINSFMSHEKILSVLLIVLCWIACESGDEQKTLAIDGKQTEQSFYADDTGGSIRFVAAEAWYAEVCKIESRAGGSRVGWLELDRYEGGAGKYALTVTLQVNDTGADRTAEITIVCGDVSVKVTVEQKALNRGDGPVPVPGSVKRIAAIRCFVKEDESGRSLWPRQFATPTTAKAAFRKSNTVKNESARTSTRSATVTTSITIRTAYGINSTHTKTESFFAVKGTSARSTHKNR